MNSRCLRIVGPISRIGEGLCWVVAACLCLTACSRDPGLGKPTSATGKVTVDGEPLKDGTVTFFRTEGGPAEFRSFQAKTDSSGQYNIDKIYPGAYRIGVLPAVAPDPLTQSADAAFHPVDPDKMDIKIGADKGTFDIRMTKQKTTPR